MTDLGTTNGWDSSWAWAINNYGDVAGHLCNYGSCEMNQTNFVGDAMYYKASTATMTDLGTLGGNTSAVFGINDSDVMVGYSEVSGGAHVAMLYDTSMHKLADLVDPQSLGTWTLLVARAIDNNGDIVGEGTPTARGLRHGFLLKPEQTIPGPPPGGESNNQTFAIAASAAAEVSVLPTAELSATVELMAAADISTVRADGSGARFAARELHGPQMSWWQWDGAEVPELFGN